MALAILYAQSRLILLTRYPTPAPAKVSDEWAAAIPGRPCRDVRRPHYVVEAGHDV